MAWEKKDCKLDYPIEEINGDKLEEHIKTVTLKMPNGRALRKIEGLIQEGGISGEEETELSIDVTLKLICVLSDLPDGGDDELHVADIMKIGEEMAPFLAGAMKSTGIGAPSSSDLPDGGEKTPTS